MIKIRAIATFVMFLNKYSNKGNAQMNRSQTHQPTSNTEAYLQISEVQHPNLGLSHGNPMTIMTIIGMRIKRK